MMTTGTLPAAPAGLGAEELRIEFLFLDLMTCERCLGTDRNLESALELTRDVLTATGVTVSVSKVHVESAEQARALRFVSSPTIRVNGRDVALELRESSCGSEACTDGCGGSIACRVWVHRGQEYTEPPVAMISEAILRHVYGAAAAGEPAAEPYELPENLARFYAGRQAAAAAPAGSACCAPAEQQTCCEPADKTACCGTTSADQPAGTCGCR